MPKVSIIIPVYNTEKYLEKCLESVRNQTLRDIEIICVDDGSTDLSPDILDRHARLDSRVKVLHKENGGLVSARKAGVAMASGTYAGYVDSDDWIEADMYERLYGIMREREAELVTCGYFLEGNYTTTHLDTVEEGFYDGEKMGWLRDNAIYRMECRETGLRGGLWCKLFSTALLRKVQEEIPDEISIAEDKACLLRYILECSSVYVLKKPLYHWVIRQESMSRQSGGLHNDYLVMVSHVYNYFQDLYLHPRFTENMRLQAEVYLIELIFLGINRRMGFRNRNMLWIDPYWMDKLPLNARIVLYGAGDLGEKYRKQLCRRRDIRVVAMVDGQYERYGAAPQEGLRVDPPEKLCELQYDYIVITVKNREKAESIKKGLLGLGIPEDAVIWCEQPEAYWRFIEAERTDSRGQ